MRLSPQKCIRHLILALVISLTPIFFWSCANVQHQASFNKNYLSKDDVRIKVAKVVNDTGYTFDIDIEQMLVSSLEEQLMEENLLNLGKEKPNLFMESRIIGYKKGSAFKRWMMPGWGATELSVYCDIKDGNNNVVGTATSSREIVAGGLYTVGAWETIFKDVANDVAKDLKEQIKAQGYAVKPKTQPQATTVAKDIEPSDEASIRPKEVQGSTSTPETSQTEKATYQTQETPKLAAIPKDAPITRVELRSEPRKISNGMQITDMLIEYNFFELSRNTQGSFVNDFIDNNDGTITDRATGLMWQRGGSSGALDNQGAKNYIEQLNRQRFASYSGWRIPTVEELASLLRKANAGGVYRASIFENNQSTCWTVDECDADYNHHLGVWIIDFKQGQVQQATFKKPSFTMNFPAYNKNHMNYVKAVRSAIK